MLRVHATLAVSEANGPGRRTVVWTQGCTLACPGCSNPATHTESGAGIEQPADEVAAWVLDQPTQGLTISGGEPMQQPEAVLELARTVRGAGRSVVLLTGYRPAELDRRWDRAMLADAFDVIVAGRYLAARRTAHALAGSANKATLLLTDTYRASDLDDLPDIEVVLSPDGVLTITGIAGVELGSFLPNGDRRL